MQRTQQLNWLDKLTALGVLALGIAPAGAGYVDVVTADNPVAYWRLGEASGTSTAADASGNSHTANYGGSPTLGVTGAITSAPASNQAVTLNGSSQYAQVDNAGAGTAFVPGSGNWTMECWVKTTSAQQGVFMAWYVGGVGNHGGGGLYDLYMQTDGTVKGLLRGDSDNVVSVTTSTTINNGSWHQVVGVLNRTTNTFALYVDGQFNVSSDASTLGDITGNQSDGPLQAVPFTIGRAYTTLDDVGGYSYFSGTLDEVALYASALSASDVLEHYNAATTVVPEPATLGLLALGGLFVLRRRR
ncbi:MAG: LamG domain-containing protein [Lentisphaeria bacterium]